MTEIERDKRFNERFDAGLEAADKARKEELVSKSSEQVATLLGALDQLRTELNEQHAYADTLRNERANIVQENLKLKLVVADLETRIADSRRLIDLLNEDFDTLKLANTDLTDDNARMTTQIAELGERLSKGRRVNQKNLDTIRSLENQIAKLHEQLNASESDADLGREAAAACDAMRSQIAMLKARVQAFENGQIASEKPVRPEDVVLLDSIRPDGAATHAQTRELLSRIRNMSTKFQHTYAEIGACRTELRESQEKLRAIEDNFRMFKSSDHSPTWAISFLHEKRAQNARLSYSMLSSKKNVWQMTWRPLVGGKGAPRIEVAAETMELLNKAVFKAVANDMPEPTDGFDRLVENAPRLAEQIYGKDMADKLAKTGPTAREEQLARALRDVKSDADYALTTHPK